MIDELLRELITQVDLAPVLAIIVGVFIMYRKFVKVELGLDVLKDQVKEIKKNCAMVNNCRLLPRPGGKRFYDGA